LGWADGGCPGRALDIWYRIWVKFLTGILPSSQNHLSKETEAGKMGHRLLGMSPRKDLTL
jgi:hypothetical protein